MSSKSNFFSPLMGDVCAISQKLVPPLCERFVFGEEGASPKQTNRVSSNFVVILSEIEIWQIDSSLFCRR